MSEPNVTEQMASVDAHPDAHRATERDEEEVLAGLYGEPDSEGFYRHADDAPADDRLGEGE